MKRLTTLIACLCIAWAAAADYLVTSRSANLKEAPAGDAAIIENIPSGTTLTLLDNGAQQAGYYHVTTAEGTEGWVYRTLVRRYADANSSAGSTTRASTSATGVELTVIDVGAGLCTLIRLPGGKYIIYDGGRSSAMTFLNTKLPAGTPIEALILSHTDADHWGAAEKIVTQYKVKKVIRTSYRYADPTETFRNAVAAIEGAPYDLEDYNLATEGDLQPGAILYESNGVKLTALCGFKEPLPEWGLTESKANNAVSIVVRLEYNGKSVILAGDAVGREDCDESNRCIATEKFMLEKAAPALLNADVLVAAHHGADNASCDLFINKVSPDYVIFSAGHAHRHPRQATVERFINFGVSPDNIFRTDKGDYEEISGALCKQEYSDEDSDSGDNTGDDHVRVVLPPAGRISVSYINH